LLGRLLGGELARPDLQDEAGAQFRGSHLRGLCRRLRGLGKLDLLQPVHDFARVEGPLLFQEQGLQARAQGRSTGQVDPGLQCLEHSLHRPALPLLEGDPGDVHLSAHLRRFAPLGPDAQDRLGFLLG